MKKETRFKFNAFLSRLADIYEVQVEELASKVDVTPSAAQTLEDEIQKSADFLKLINIVPVPDKSAEAIGLGVESTVAGTTDTTTKDREPTDPSGLTKITYTCEQTNFDTAIKYNKLDLWAKFKDFQLRLRNAIVRRQALDRIMIGFNGVERASTSDRKTNKLLQDVNVGWLQKIREDAPERVMSKIIGEDGQVASETVRIGLGGDYFNLDALVMDAVNSLIDDEFQDDTDLVVICGRELLNDKYFPIVNKDQENSESLAAGVIISQKRLGNLPAVRAPYFPADALLITRLDNLSIYWQEGTRRRHISDNPKRDQIENYESVNEAYVVESYRGVALVENIEVLPAKQPEQAGKQEEA